MMRRPAFRRCCARNTFLALLALWGLLAFDAEHIVFHLRGDDVLDAHDAGSHSGWDGVRFHTGTLAEAVFVVPPPPRPRVARLNADRPLRIDGIPLLVPDSRAPPAA